eukprot:CAMPEP_0172584060 /NCGR_PEP_ID=MMETSP1068-20121228/3638_1 /TAXON_ID=35684 /ORGANISM="Pseudopedinella elastica, Strain CCMP716" /LENGTH=238 /DNA_ID=CAMNT_0013378107 /DNA_START=76 /DNA_END=792 /DNA_ORIENTATION=+
MQEAVVRRLRRPGLAGALLLALGFRPSHGLMVRPGSWVKASGRDLVATAATTADLKQAETQREDKIVGKPPIEVGEVLPFDLKVEVIKTEGDKMYNELVPLVNYFKGRKVAVVTVPGAFTPKSSTDALPSYVELADAFQEKGVDKIVVMSVNDPFVLYAWSKTFGEGASKLAFVGDGKGEVAEALGLAMETGTWGGLRFRRASMIVDDGVVKAVNVEEAGKFTEQSGAALLLSQLGGM